MPEAQGSRARLRRGGLLPTGRPLIPPVAFNLERLLRFGSGRYAVFTSLAEIKPSSPMETSRILNF